MPPRRGLDTDLVVDTAATIVDTEGIEGLSLKRLADQLGVQTPSLYNHVDGLAGLHRLLALRNARMMADCLTVAVLGKAGAPALAALAQTYRDYIKAHPGLYALGVRPAQLVTPFDPERAAAEERMVTVAVAVVASFGLAGDDAIHAVRALRSVVHGFTTLEVAGGFGIPLDLDESFHRLVEMLCIGLEAGRQPDASS